MQHRVSGIAACSRGKAAACGVLAGLAVAAWPVTGKAQNFQSYFPPGTTGYDQQLGVTVLTRLRPLYETPSINLGGFTLSPSLDQSLVYNSNVTGNGSGAWASRTTGSLSANSNWTRDSLGASLGFTHNQYFTPAVPAYTDWNAGLAGGYTINDSLLQAAYSHQSYHQLGVAIGVIRSETPVLDQTDTAHLDYTFNLSRFAITPDISASSYRFGVATQGGVPLDQKFLNRDVLAGGVTGRYSMSDEGGLLVVLRAVTSDYTNPQPGQPSNNANSFLLLGGLDYQAKGVWRYRLLLGVEVREFQASQFPARTAPVMEASVIWTPTGLTTLTGKLSREIEDPESAGTNGYVFTQAGLVVDHELLRNVFLQGRGGIEYAQYLQNGGGTQTSFSIGGGVTWLLNRNVRLSLDYDFTKLTGSSSTPTTNPLNQTTVSTGSFSQSIAALTVHVAL